MKPTSEHLNLDDATFGKLRTANILRDQEWNPSNRIDLAFRGNELAGEVGEACNIIKKLVRTHMGLKGTTANYSQLADELADVIICADLIAMHCGIDLGTAVKRKFNQTSENRGFTIFME